MKVSILKYAAVFLWSPRSNFNPSQRLQWSSDL